MNRNSVRAALGGLATTLVCATADAQGPAFESPGTPSYATSGQTSGFSNEFNPAIGAVIDFYADYLNDEGGEDGFDAHLRLVELNASAYIDPKAWAYVALVSEDAEAPEIEEAAVEYIGLPGNSTVRVGQFFVDFGKQMQQHLEELRTLERPLPLREYLGEELAGLGAQYDYWFALNDTTPVRFSVGVFTSLLPGHGHEDEEDELEPEAIVPSRKQIDQMSFNARLTGMTDVGETGLFQLGASARFVPDFAFEVPSADLEADGLSNAVYGLDATFQRTDDTGIRRTLLGGELLFTDGDLAGSVDDPLTPTTIDVVNDSALGYFVFGDYAWSKQSSAGVQLAMAELPEDPSADATELDLYYTLHFTEFRRLRFGVTLADEDGDQVARAYVQFTNFFGNHSHGLNW